MPVGLYRPLMGFGVNEYHSSMAQSLKTKYLLLALGVGAGLSLLLGGFAYYEHRIDTADIDQLTYATVEQEAGRRSRSRAQTASRKVTGALLAPALAAGNSAAVASIAGRLLEERDIERVEVTRRARHGAVQRQQSAGRRAPDVAPQLSRRTRPLTVTTASPRAAQVRRAAAAFRSG